MSVTHGMNPAVVRAIADRFGSYADELSGIGEEAQRAIGSLDWHGPDVERFTSDWGSSGRPHLDQVAGVLETLERQLRAQADEQDRTSQAGGAGQGSGGSGSGPGGGRGAGSGGGSGGWFNPIEAGWEHFNDAVHDTAAELWHGLVQGGGDVIEGAGILAAGAGALLQQATGATLEVVGDGLNVVEDGLHSGMSWVADGVEWGTDKAGGAVSGTGSFVGGLLDKVGLEGAGDVVRGVSDGIGNRIEAAGDAVPRLVDATDTAIRSVTNPLSQGRVPTATELAAGSILLMGNLGGLSQNILTGTDNHWFDDGTAFAGNPKHVDLGDATTPKSLADLVSTVVEADSHRDKAAGEGNIRISTVTTNGHTAYVVSVPGTSNWGPGTDGQSPIDLTGNLVAMTGTPSVAQQSVELAMAKAGIPPGAPVMLVGHSQGGIITSHLTADPAFMSRYNVTAMMTYGSPIETVNVDPRVQTLALQHSTDVVPKLDLGGLTPIGLPMTGYGGNVHQVTLDNVGAPWALGDNHAGLGYRESILSATGRDAADLNAFAQSSQVSQFLATDTSSVTIVDIPVGRSVRND